MARDAVNDFLAACAPLFKALKDSRARKWLDTLEHDIGRAWSVDSPAIRQWRDAVAALPPGPEEITAELDSDIVGIGRPGQLGQDQLERLNASLERLIPWRKGPFRLFDTLVDSEWRSDLKWNRLRDHIQPLDGKLALDVGCGNGYHCWRMLGAGAARVIGIDPTLLFIAQFQCAKHFLPQQPVDLLPLGIEQIPANLQAFDSVFSMGVLYHRRSPIDHLMQLRDCLRRDGELVLETLVVDGKKGYALMPEKRYAGMRNVWFLPSPATLTQWLSRCGFRDIRCVDMSPTTAEEQRPTRWTNHRSLIDCIDPENPSRTVEGHPAPLRAIFIANRA